MSVYQGPVSSRNFFLLRTGVQITKAIEYLETGANIIGTGDRPALNEGEKQ